MRIISTTEDVTRLRHRPDEDCIAFSSLVGGCEDASEICLDTGKWKFRGCVYEDFKLGWLALSESCLILGNRGDQTQVIEAEQRQLMTTRSYTRIKGVFKEWHYSRQPNTKREKLTHIWHSECHDGSASRIRDRSKSKGKLSRNSIGTFLDRRIGFFKQPSPCTWWRGGVVGRGFAVTRVNLLLATSASIVVSHSCCFFGL